jgi:hypothetical protein
MSFVSLPTDHEVAIYANEIFDGLAQGYCKHGTYVGGCAEDWICGACESGEDSRDFVQVAADRLFYIARNTHERQVAERYLKHVVRFAEFYSDSPVTAMRHIARMLEDFNLDREF